MCVCLKHILIVSDLRLKREPDSAYESAWNIIQCQNAYRGKNSKNDKLKRHETLEEELREWWRYVGSGAGCSVPRQAPYGSVSEQRGTEVVMQKQWLSLYVGLALQSFKMSSPYEADHCSLSCFPFSSFHWLSCSLSAWHVSLPRHPNNHSTQI